MNRSPSSIQESSGNPSRGNSPVPAQQQQPQQQEHAPPHQSSSKAAAATLPVVPRKPFPKALVIHPDADRRQRIFVALTSRRFCVTAVASFQAALPLLKFPKNDFDVIFVDCGESQQQQQQQQNLFQQQNNTSVLDFSSAGVTAAAASSIFAAESYHKHDPLAATSLEASLADPSSNKNNSASTSARDPVALLSSTQFVHVVRIREQAADSQIYGRVSVKPTEEDGGDVGSRNSAALGKMRLRIGGATEAEAVRVVRSGLQSLTSVSGALSLAVEEQRREEQARSNTKKSSNVVVAGVGSRRGDFFSRDDVVPPPGGSSRSLHPLQIQQRASSRIFGRTHTLAGGDNSDADSNNDNDDDVGRDLSSTIVITRDGIDHDDEKASHTVPRVARQHHHELRKQRERMNPDELNSLVLTGEAAQRALIAARSRHVIIGLCDSSAAREQLADLAVNSTSLGVERFSTLWSKPATVRSACSPLFDTLLRYPLKMHLDQLESTFVSQGESVARFAERPTLQQLSALLADITERRVGGQLRVVHAPDWRKLTEAVATGDSDGVAALLQPIPRSLKMEKDGRGVSTVLTNQAIDGGHDIGATTAHSLYRAQADVRRAQEQVQLEKEECDATNMELEASHERNQKLVAELEASMEAQRKLEEHVKHLTEQLGRKEWECAELRRDTESALEQVRKANDGYERGCEALALATLEADRLKSEHEEEIMRIRRAAASGRSISAARRNGSPASTPPPAQAQLSSPAPGTAANSISQQQQQQQQQQPRRPSPPAATTTTTSLIRPTRRGFGGAGGAFRTFNAAQFMQKQEARCIEVEVGLKAPLYLDLLADARSKCLFFMKENVRLREEVFQANSEIYRLKTEKVVTAEELVASLGFKKGAALLGSTVSNMNNNNFASSINFAASRRGGDLFASMRRAQQQQLSSNSNNSNLQQHQQQQQAASSASLDIARRRSFLGGGGAAARSSNSFMAESVTSEQSGGDTSPTNHQQRHASLVAESKAVQRKWKHRIQKLSQTAERSAMAAQDALSAVTIKDNVLAQLKDGIKFHCGKFEYSALRDVRCRAEFADDAVEGALVQHPSISTANQKAAAAADPSAALENAAQQLQQQQQQATHNTNNNDASQQQRKKRNNAADAINVTTGGTGGTAAAVIHNLIATSQARSQEPIRAFLRSTLERLWGSVKGVTQTAMLDVMTTHSALEHGLERLLSGAGISSSLPSSSHNVVGDNTAQATAATMSPTQASLNHQHQHQPLSSRAPSSISLSAQQQHQPVTPNSNTPLGAAVAQPLMRREKQAQLAKSLRRLFLDRLTATLTRLFDQLSSGFSSQVVDAYVLGQKTMEQEIFKAVQPLALENAKLATALLVAKTQAHSQLGTVTAAAGGVSKEQQDAVDFFKTVSKRDSWVQTRPVIIRDPVVDDL